MMRWPAMYFFLCGHRFSFIHSGISETASRLGMLVRSVLAIIRSNFLFAHTIRMKGALPITKLTRSSPSEIKIRPVELGVRRFYVPPRFYGEPEFEKS